MDLKTIRQERNATMQEVSVSVDITESYYSLIESKKRRPSVAVAKRLGRYFGIDWTVFFEDDQSAAQEENSA